MFRRHLLLGSMTLLLWGAAAAAPPPDEQARIDKLIHFIETQKGMKFVRNGIEYECSEAAKFLRGKLEKMGKDVTTAQEFVERIASKSTMSGKPYHVKFADGKTMLASQFLGEALKRIEGQPA